MSDGRLLFREFLRAPTRVATVTASSDALVAEMVRPIPASGAPVVVELGAGTGQVTVGLQRHLRGRGRHLAVEINPVLARRLAERHPAVTVVCADAAELPDLLAAHGLSQVDVVSSLLPWVAYDSAPIPSVVAGVLTPDGVFTQVSLWMTQRMEPARRQLRDIRATFDDVTTSPTVWRNLPPARVHVARHPRRATRQEH